MIHVYSGTETTAAHAKRGGATQSEPQPRYPSKGIYPSDIGQNDKSIKNIVRVNFRGLGLTLQIENLSFFKLLHLV